VDLPNGWDPRAYQLPLWLYLERGGTRADVAAHRRWGKDDVALHWTAVSAVTGRVGTYWHMLPEYSQARKAIWNAINPHTGLRRIDEAFPPEVRDLTREDEMFIRLKSGSTWQVVGSDSYNALVGSQPIGIVFSEWALAKPDAWTYLRPILAENGGWALFIWTPRGRNHATRAFEARERDDTWYTLRSPATDTDVFSAEQLENERAELIAELGSEEEGDARYRQEYLVDFDAAVPGAYFGSLISKAQAEGRIGKFPYDPSLPVHTAWDLGVDDYTAIWFFQENGREVRAIEYAEFADQGPDSIVPIALPELIPEPEKRAAALDAIGRSVPYTYGTHHLPHDVMAREWGAGAKSRFETLKSLGVKPINVGVAQNPEDRINAARRLLPAVSFDAERCSTGLDRLRNYRKRWNTSLLTYIGPLHDENSHGADAFGEFAVNRRVKPPAEEPKEPAPKRYQKPRREVSAWTGL
jgi:phage terminase large subunit